MSKKLKQKISEEQTSPAPRSPAQGPSTTSPPVVRSRTYSHVEQNDDDYLGPSKEVNEMLQEFYTLLHYLNSLKLEFRMDLSEQEKILHKVRTSHVPKEAGQLKYQNWKKEENNLKTEKEDVILRATKYKISYIEFQERKLEKLIEEMKEFSKQKISDQKIYQAWRNRIMLKEQEQKIKDEVIKQNEGELLKKMECRLKNLKEELQKQFFMKSSIFHMPLSEEKNPSPQFPYLWNAHAEPERGRRVLHWSRSPTESRQEINMKSFRADFLKDDCLPREERDGSWMENTYKTVCKKSGSPNRMYKDTVIVETSGQTIHHVKLGEGSTSWVNNVIEKSCSQHELLNDMTKNEVILPEQGVSRSEISRCNMGNPPGENALEPDQIISSHTNPDMEESNLTMQAPSEMPEKAPSEVLLQSDKFPVIVPHHGHQPLKIDPDIISEHLAVLSIKTEPVEKLNNACLFRIGISLKQLRQALTSGQSITHDLGIREVTEVQRRKERRVSLDITGHLNVRPKEENLSNIPAVVIEPASNNEGDGEDHEVLVNESKDAVEDFGTEGTEGLASETSETVSEPKISKDVQPASSEEQPVSADDDMPPGFLYKVEALHDFEAANSDELNLRRGDIVLVVPSVAAADQEAGWLTGIRECDWLRCRDAATCKGLFPENFTCRRE